MQDSFILYEPTNISDILAGLSRQVKAVAFAISYATDDGMSYTQNALQGGSDILHKAAAAMDDLVELPLPDIASLGTDTQIAEVAKIRMKGRKATDLLYRVKQLGQFQHAELSDTLQGAFRSMSGLEQKMIQLDTEDLDDHCRDALKELRQDCTGTVNKLEASLSELRRLNDLVSQIVPIVNELHESPSKDQEE